MYRLLRKNWALIVFFRPFFIYNGKTQPMRIIHIDFSWAVAGMFGTLTKKRGDFIP